MRAIWVLSLLLLSFVTWKPASATGHDAGGPPVQKPERAGAAVDARAGPRSDSIWMVSTRQLACPCGDGTEKGEYRFRRYDAAGGWQAADEDQWASAESADMTTLVYVHGNRIESNEAAGRGLAAYRALLRCAPDSPPVRFVIWSWPSSKIHGPRPKRDARAKMARTDCESYLLARFLNGLDPQSPLGLLGYSFGARIVSGALHLATGGSLGRFQLPDVAPRPANSTRVALLAPAMNSPWWMPSGYHDRTFSAVERLLLLYNRCDPVLRLYPKLDRRCPASALGYTGFARPATLGDDAWRLEQANACCQIGKTHDEDAYFASETLMRRVREVLLAP